MGWIDKAITIGLTIGALTAIAIWANIFAHILKYGVCNG